MASQNVTVNQIQRLDPPLARFAGGLGRTTVDLAGGGTCLLDAADPVQLPGTRSWTPSVKRGWQRTSKPTRRRT